MQENNRYSEVQMLDNYIAYGASFLAMLSKFQHSWDGRLSLNKGIQTSVWTNFDRKRPIHSASYQAGPWAQEFVKHEIDIMLAMNIIERAQTEWASPIVYAHKKDVTLQFCVDYHNLNAVAI